MDGLYTLRVESGGVGRREPEDGEFHDDPPGGSGRCAGAGVAASRLELAAAVSPLKFAVWRQRFFAAGLRVRLLRGAALFRVAGVFLVALARSVSVMS